MKLVSIKHNWWAVLLIIILLMSLHYTGILKPMERVLRNGLEPLLVWTHLSGSAANQAIAEIRAKRDWPETVRQLEAEKNQLLAANAKLQYLRQENETLRQYLHWQEQNNYQTILAKVLLADLPQADLEEQSAILINRGQADGIKTGLAVVDQSGVVLGRVIMVDQDWSKVALLTNPTCQVAVSLVGGGEVSGIAQGNAGLTVKVDFVPQTAVVQIGDLVMTAGLEETVPQGLLLGKVSAINKSANALWQSIITEPTARLENLTTVAVLLP